MIHYAIQVGGKELVGCHVLGVQDAQFRDAALSVLGRCRVLDNGSQTGWQRSRRINDSSSSGGASTTGNIRQQEEDSEAAAAAQPEWHAAKVIIVEGRAPVPQVAAAPGVH